MGTVPPYSRDVATKKWVPADGAEAARLQALRTLHEETKELQAQIDAKMEILKVGVTEFGDRKGKIQAPVNALAEFFGVQRKTIYRWMGQEMS